MATKFEDLSKKEQEAIRQQIKKQREEAALKDLMGEDGSNE